MDIRTDVSHAPIDEPCRLGSPEGLPPIAPKRNRGAPAGNSNRRVHGCRSPRIIEAQRKIIKDETGYGRLDREILLAIFQQVMIKTCGATTRVAARLTLRLVRMVCLKYGVHADDEDALVNACERLKFDLPLTPELAAKLAGAFRIN